MAWEEVTVLCIKGVWNKIWPSNENYGTNFDNVDPMGITEVLESHSQPLYSEELYDLVLQLTEQQKADEDEEGHGTKAMQTKDLTDIPSAIDMAAEKFCISTLTGNTALQLKGTQEPCYTLITESCKKR